MPEIFGDATGQWLQLGMVSLHPDRWNATPEKANQLNRIIRLTVVGQLSLTTQRSTFVYCRVKFLEPSWNQTFIVTRSTRHYLNPPVESEILMLDKTITALTFNPIEFRLEFKPIYWRGTESPVVLRVELLRAP